MFDKIPWERLCEQGALLVVDPDASFTQCDVDGCTKGAGHMSNHTIGGRGTARRLNIDTNGRRRVAETGSVIDSDGSPT